ncbi:uncharacterized protein LY89DRAFT_652278 [Mollisia scopiformis]|uniref:Regulator of chromosome condensation-like protein n=1 Tax=Mollisia scopiformis TaxID=149040 RepID=A0A194WZ97_MOLSC|nr:uncharacterized protein LY89DRAFT_652278 [Mollisia scopiformis]KUJ12917.1 hypothetical protein LY89DRAFT_652278 [Mollisia scopiformis]
MDSRQSGNFDDPPASESYRETADRIVREILNNTTQSSDDISPSGELYRAIERFHRRRGHPPGQTSNSSTMSSDPDSERRQRWLRREGHEASPLFVLPSQPTAAEPTPRERAASRLAGMSARRGRPRMSVSDRYMERHRAIMGENASSNGLADLQHAGRQLEQASSNLRALLDDPVPNISSPTLEPEYGTESERRVKRRKIDSDRLDSGFKGFSYGRYGQVEPGKLTMEIVSCDGGIFQEQAGHYSAENVLRNDSTVYCTKSNRCNLVLRHQGATVFSLKELVIKAPHSGYTAPVQEGMVFISMSSDDLLTRTAQYQIQYSPPRPRRSGSRDLPPIMSIRHNDDGTMTTAQARARRLYNIGLEDEECDYRTAQIPPEFTENAPAFQVTTECSDSEGDGPTHPSRSRLHRVMGLRFEDSDSSDEEPTPEQTSAWHEDYILNMGRSPRLRRRETASNITLAEAEEASQIATQEAVRAVGGELMAPHAKFFIERDKSKCTVRFDPPVTGRFILLKMWSPHHSASSNIDIQSVVAKGFAGPRFFPAIEMR